MRGAPESSNKCGGSERLGLGGGEDGIRAEVSGVSGGSLRGKLPAHELQLCLLKNV